MDWRHEALCRDEDPELFFPVGNSGPALAQIASAKLVCNRCPVTNQCLAWIWPGCRSLGRHERRRTTRPQASQGSSPYPQRCLTNYPS